MLHQKQIVYSSKMEGNKGNSQIHSNRFSNNHRKKVNGILKLTWMNRIVIITAAVAAVLRVVAVVEKVVLTLGNKNIKYLKRNVVLGFRNRIFHI